MGGTRKSETRRASQVPDLSARWICCDMGRRVHLACEKLRRHLLSYVSNEQKGLGAFKKSNNDGREPRHRV